MDGQDRIPVATYNLPTFNYGINGGATWKSVDFSMNWQGSAGVYNQYDEVFTEVGPFDGGAALSMYTDRWHTLNVWDDPWHPDTEWVEGHYPATGRPFNTGTTGIKKHLLYPFENIRGRVYFAKAWSEKVNVNVVRVYVNGYNLLTFSGLKYMDPERPGTRGALILVPGNSVLFYNYPVNRVINFGVVLKF